MRKQKSIKRSINFAPETLKALDTLAIKSNKTTSDLVREYVENGLNIDGHKQDIDFITSIIRQELTAIYNIDDIKEVIEKQVERMVKLQVKTGKLSSSSFFLLVHMISSLWDNLTTQNVENLIEMSTKHGVDYLQMKDYKINDFLEDVNALIKQTDYFDNDNYKED